MTRRAEILVYDTSLGNFKTLVIMVEGNDSVGVKCEEKKEYLNMNAKSWARVARIIQEL